MSYSFTIKADTKDEAGVKVEAKLGEVVNAQPAHEADRQAAQNAAEAFIEVLREPNADECVNVSVSGSLSWSEEKVFTGANVSVHAYLGPKT
jgi:hypothetical protein